MQQQVAGIVTQGVVEALELIQIEEQDRPSPLAPGTRCQGLLQSVQQEPPVGQPSHGIVERQLLDIRLRPLTLGDVGEGKSQRAWLAPARQADAIELNLDHRAGFLLAQIDGSVNFEDLFALSGLPRLDTARILATLLHEGVIAS